MLQLAVARRDGQWCIFENGDVIARDLTRSAAIAQVQTLALSQAALGREVQTLISDHIGLLDKRYYGGTADA